MSWTIEEINKALRYENRNNLTIETYKPFDSSMAEAVKATLAHMENHMPEGGEQ